MTVFNSQPADSNPSIASTQIKSILRKILNEQKKPADWLDGLAFENQGPVLKVTFIHKYFYQWFQKYKLSFFEEEMARYFGDIKYVYHESASFHAGPAPVGLPAKGCEPATKKQQIKNDLLADKFSNFIFNEKSRFQISVVIKAATSQDPCLQSLLICGKSGTGKTHLLRAVYETLKHNESETQFYRAREFCELCALNASSVISFCPDGGGHIFLIDDIMDLHGNDTVQQLLVNWLDETGSDKTGTYANNLPQNRIFLAGTGNAREILNKFTSQLRSRLENGCIIELCEPDLDVRFRYMERANREKKLGLNRQQLVNLARRASHIPGLNGLINKIELFIRLYGHSPNPLELENISGSSAAIKTTAHRNVIGHIAGRFNFKPEDLIGSGRKPDLVLARQIAMFVCRRQLGLSYPEIGKLFGGKDHSTVMHAINKIQKLQDTDKDMHNLLTELENATL